MATHRGGRRMYSSSSLSSLAREGEGSFALDAFIQPATMLCVNAIDMSICAWRVSRSTSGSPPSAISGVWCRAARAS